jgi:hypothetical protein
MARYLCDLTKIEPCSVDQTFFFEKGHGEPFVVPANQQNLDRVTAEVLG